MLTTVLRRGLRASLAPSRTLFERNTLCASAGAMRFKVMAAAAAASAAAVASSLSVCEADVFESKGDPYRGVSVAAVTVSACPTVEAFGEKLSDSLAAWKAMGKRGVWLQIPSARSELIAVAQAQGLRYHHAERDYLMMCCWLGEGESMLPANASHSVGVGIVCTNSHGELLVVQEASGPAANRKGGFWKVPTGLVDAGEELAAACVREMKEETSIDVEFTSLVGFREMQRALHGKSNLFFLCLCRLAGPEEIHIQKEELAAARWMPLDEFAALPYYQGDHPYAELTRASVAAARGEVSGLARYSPPAAPSKGPPARQEAVYVLPSRL